ncbi:Ig-like domain-containing protein [Planctomicrobium sp. SH668]|uniref:Ig-like domain-containing protein n=1 Tax=Planctomicrobium sp. SH668 TaxID=3448126 RepID=UPI003F5C3BEE
MLSFRPILALGGIAVLLLGVGCGGDGVELGNVEGTLTVDGKPVPGATVVFNPQDSEVRSPSYGTTDANGHYKLAFNLHKEGAIPAKHFVQIELERLTKSELREYKENGMTPPEFFEIPKKYRKPDALEYVVKRGSNVIDITLDSK